MYPVDRNEMSAARQHMMNRRRRSLTILGGGSFVMFLLTLVVGGGLFEAMTAIFMLGFVGYLYFLRTQARKDRERREHRQERMSSRAPRIREAARREAFFPESRQSIVQIDDDDLALHNLETIDLTGLYSEEGRIPVAAQRRAS